MSDRELAASLRQHVALMHEHLLSVKEAARQFQPKRSTATIRNWIARGIFHQGELIFLESIKIGGSLFTSQEAIQRFVQRTNP